MIDIWRIHQMVGLIAATVFFCLFIFPAYGKRFALALCYVLVSAIVIFQNPESVWPELQIRLDATAANSFGATILIVATLALIPYRYLIKLMSALAGVAMINSLLVLIYGYGIFNAASMDCTFISLMLPYIFLRMNLRTGSKGLDVLTALLLTCAPIAAIISAQGSTAYFIVVACLVAFLIQTKQWVFTSVLSVPLALGFVTQRENFLNSNGRFEIWKLFMSWFSEHANIWLGTGTGTFQWIGPAIQGTQKNLFLFMHNEYLQALFEQGIIGVFLFSMVLVSSLLKARQSTWLFVSLAGVCVAMLTQFPFRYFTTQLLILVFLRLVQIEHTRGK